MAKGSKKPQLDDNAEVPISSMIDVVFLLIIFFVVTASIDKEIEDEQVILARAPLGKQKPITKKDPRTLTINVREDGAIWMGMHEVSSKDIKNELERLKKTYGGNEFPIVIRGDHRAPHGFIKEVMDAITATQLYKVNLDAEKVTSK